MGTELTPRGIDEDAETEAVLHVQIPANPDGKLFQIVFDNSLYMLIRPEWAQPGSWVDLEVLKAKEFTAVVPSKLGFQVRVGMQLVNIRCPPDISEGDSVTFSTRTFRFVGAPMETAEINITVAAPKWTQDKMQVIDVEMTLKRFASLLPKRLNLEDVVLTGVNVCDPEVKRDLVIASWRWDLEDGRTCSKANISNLIKQSKARDKKYCAVDCFSVQQNQDPDAVMRELLAFSSLYGDGEIAVITAYGVDTVLDFDMFRRTTERPWIMNEWFMMGSRVTIGDLLVLPPRSGGVWNPLLFHGHIDYMFGEYLLSPTRLFYHVLVILVYTIMVVFYTLVILSLFIVPIVFFLVVDGQSSKNYQKSMEEQKRIFRRANFQWVLIEPAKPLMRHLVYSAFYLPFYPINVFLFHRDRKLIAHQDEFQELQMLDAMLSNCVVKENPCLFVGDMVHISANFVHDKLLRKGVTLKNRQAVHLLEKYVDIGLGQHISTGHFTCLKCRLRVVFILSLLQNVFKHLKSSKPDPPLEIAITSTQDGPILENGHIVLFLGFCSAFSMATENPATYDYNSNTLVLDLLAFGVDAKMLCRAVVGVSMVRGTIELGSQDFVGAWRQAMDAMHNCDCKTTSVPGTKFYDY